MRTIKQLCKEYWIPFVIAVAWTLAAVYGPAGTLGRYVGYARDLFTSFALASWFTGQFNRVKREHRTADSFDKLDLKVDAIQKQLSELGFTRETVSRWAREAGRENEKPRNSPGAAAPPPTRTDLSVIGDKNSGSSKTRGEDETLDAPAKVFSLAARRAQLAAMAVLMPEEAGMRFAA